MMFGVASSVVVKVPDEQDRIYLWSDSLERDKVMALLAKPPSGSVWDTFMSKGASERTHVVTAQISAKSANLKNNGGGKKTGRTNAKKSMASMMDVTKEDKNDDHDEDDDLFGDPNICTNMMKNQEALEVECVEVFVSKRMHDNSSKTTSVFVAFSPPKSTFYIK